jgi:2-oxoglutarate ferredoxin oxidoreductase subunit beta
MVDVNEYGTYETAWCPGCGNFAIIEQVKRALAESGLAPHEVLFVSGIGQAAKAPHYFNCNLFNGLHGRALPAAQGAQLANPALKVVCETGDGCAYGEGGNHFLAAVRRNADITVLVHDNQIYGLTKGQASPTSDEGLVTKAQPWGSTSVPFNPVLVAVAMRASFVARAFSGNEKLTVAVIREAIAHRGFALVDILQPCVSFNKVNTFAWYKKRCAPVGEAHDPTDWRAAMDLAATWGDSIPVGVIYRNDRPPLHERLVALKDGPLVGRRVDREALGRMLDSFA